jgi:hypothetical protein
MLELAQKSTMEPILAVGSHPPLAKELSRSFELSVTLLEIVMADEEG